MPFDGLRARSAPPLSSRSVSLTGLLAGGLLGLVAAGQAWWRAVGSGVSVSLSGSAATGGLATALAVVVPAGVLLVLTLGTRGRRAVGVLVALAGIGMLVTGAFRSRPTAATVRDKMAAVSLIDSFTLHATAWGSLYAAAGALVAGAALLLVLTAGSWPLRTARFDRRTAAVDLAEDPAQAWRALDAGVDPTVSERDTTA
jgi:hypothetical protein